MLARLVSILEGHDTTSRHHAPAGSPHTAAGPLRRGRPRPRLSAATAACLASTGADGGGLRWLLRVGDGLESGEVEDGGRGQLSARLRRRLVAKSAHHRQPRGLGLEEQALVAGAPHALVVICTKHLPNTLH